CLHLERVEVGGSDRLLPDMRKRVWLISRSREEPRLDHAPTADPLNPPGALGQPHVPQAPSEQPPLPRARRLRPERAQPAVDQLHVNPLAIVRATQFV